jgi:hypothetical protein
MATPEQKPEEIPTVVIPKEQLTGKARRLANLRPPFKKGEVHNPKGRPKGMCVGEYFREMLPLKCPADPKGRCWGEVIAERMMVEAAKGNVRAAIEIEDRVAGKSKQSIEMTQPKDEPMLDLKSIPLADRIAILRILSNAKRPDAAGSRGAQPAPGAPAGNP